MRKHIISAVALLAIVLSFIPGIVAGDCDNPISLIISSSNAAEQFFEIYGQTFTPEYDIEPTILYLYMRRPHTSPTPDLNVFVYAVTWNEGDEYWQFTGEPLLEVEVSTTGWSESLEWHTFNFNEGVLLEAGQTYGIICISETPDKYFYWGRAGTSVLDDAVSGYGYGSTCGKLRNICGIDPASNTDFNFIVSGCWGYTSAVTTLPAYFDTDGVLYLPGMVHSLGTDNKANVYIDYGVTEDIVDTKDCGYITKAGAPDGIFYTNLYDVPGGVTLYYRARMVGVQSGIEREGEIESVFCPGNETALECTVIENIPEYVKFDVFVEDLGECESVTLNLSYATSYCSLMDGGDTMLVASEVTTIGDYFLTDSSTFEEGETYYFRALMIYEDDIVAASKYRVFTRYDTSKPGIINAMVGFLDRYGLGGGTGGTMNINWLWWILIFAALALIWLLASRPKNKKFGAFIGITGTMVVLGFVVAYGLVDIWLVALLSIIAGACIYLFVIRPLVKGRG